MGKFVEEIYKRKYAHKMGNRKKTFKQIFNLLEAMNKDYYVIMETGSCRIADNYVGDGMSTLLFDSFVSYFDGEVISVDSDKKTVEFARNLVGPKTKVYHDDSVRFLHNFERAVDLLYLDSYDLNEKKPHDSALHHMKEFSAAANIILPGTIIAVDDHKSETASKGMYISNYMENIGIKRVVDGYQIAWIWEDLK